MRLETVNGKDPVDVPQHEIRQHMGSTIGSPGAGLFVMIMLVWEERPGKSQCCQLRAACGVTPGKDRRCFVGIPAVRWQTSASPKVVCLWSCLASKGAKTSLAEPCWTVACVVVQMAGGKGREA
jgi:hypothetical protein